MAIFFVPINYYKRWPSDKANHTVPLNYNFIFTRVFRVESAKIYRGNLNFHVTGRGFSTRGLVALHDTWHFHERTHASSTRRIMGFPRDESWNFHEMSCGVHMQRSGKPTRNFDVVTRVVVQSRSLCNASVGARHMVNSPWLVTAFTVRNLFTIELG